MRNQHYRLPTGGRIDRAQPLRFSFNGRTMTGYAGDTLASALLANGVHLVGRSFKYHRPRGILSAGVEEPNAWVQLGQGGHEEPNVAATTAELFDGLEARSPNCWPSVEFDLGAINDRIASLLVPGFYYKTFMNPRRLWPRYERAIRRMAGLGTLPNGPDSEDYDEANAHTDILVIGGGPTGLAAALAASRSGARVILADADREFGGLLMSDRAEIDNMPAEQWVSTMLKELQQNARVRILSRTTIFGYYDHNFLVGLEKRTDHLAPADRDGKRQRLWQIRAQQVIVATGAHERPLVFADNDRPGIMLAASARTYLNRYAVLPGRNPVLFTNNDSAYATAIDLVQAGARVNAVIDARTEIGAAAQAAIDAGIDVIPGSAVVATRGGKRINRVQIGSPGKVAASDTAPAHWLDCDCLLVSGGWSPVVHLFSQAGGRLRYDVESACFVPGDSPQSVSVAGAAHGEFPLTQGLSGGYRAGLAVVESCGYTPTSKPAPVSAEQRSEAALIPLWSVPAQQPDAKKFVDYFNDVTTSGIALAVREGYVSVEHLKRYTTAGMGLEQGKTGNINALAVLAAETGTAIHDVGTTTYRPPYTPVTFGALAASRKGGLYKPLRKTPMDGWHEQAGAVFENFGLWRRPQYYPRPDLGMDQAVAEEVRAVRENVGMVDISTLGKIHLCGPDVAEFLNRLYPNRWDTLQAGRCRYGVMTKEDAMVFDDGVVARIDSMNYHMTTTTGGAAAVYNWMNDLLQTDWPDLRVYMTSVTTQWAAVSLAGPNARKFLSQVCDDIDLSVDNFPFMSLADGRICGLPARVFCVSFTGEQSFEINVPARYGLALWEGLLQAGSNHGLRPFGLEAMDLMRMEKGHFIVGRDTDGTATIGDLGLQKLIKIDKEQFLGKRSLLLDELKRGDRPQLVGLLSNDNRVLPEGGQLVENYRPGEIHKPEGHVTSSGLSPTLEKPIALAMLKGGRQRQGQSLQVYSLGEIFPVTVTSPHFYDPESYRLHR